MLEKFDEVIYEGETVFIMRSYPKNKKHEEAYRINGGKDGLKTVLRTELKPTGVKHKQKG